MKRTIILLLCLLALSACSSVEEESGAEESIPEIGTNESDENQSEAEVETETEAEAEPEELPDIESGREITVGERREILYFTSSSGEESEGKILGALILDDTHYYDDYTISFNVNRPRIENILSDERFYAWVDSSLYPHDSGALSGEAREFCDADVVYSLSGDEYYVGKTSDGFGYCFYKADGVGDEAARYYGFVETGGGKMARMMFADDGEHGNAWEECFRPLLDGAEVYLPGRDVLKYSRIVYEYDESESWDEKIEKYRLVFTLPDSWVMGTTGEDLPRMLAGRYSTKRFEPSPILLSPENHDEDFEDYHNAEPEYVSEESGVTANGYEYINKVRLSSSEGEFTESGSRLGVEWHIVWLKPSDTDDYNIGLGFVVYEDDPADYFETHCRPVLDSIELTAVN